ncbi:piercer of microtubule wall 1 protein-like [Clavelina lepadiformis]|uniref:piercer of microtubule wall 1 protein-like n=1 Tax=Clavelina lepadiformis TaxID=159417 RepID=UPI0040411C84
MADASVEMSAQKLGSTSDHYKTDDDLPGRFEHPEWIKGYDTTDPHPIYRTSNMIYGSRAPSVHTVPTTFQPRSQKFSTHLGDCGMYKNNSLNTYTEKSIVTGPDNAGLTKLDRLNFHKSFSSNPNV